MNEDRVRETVEASRKETRDELSFWNTAPMQDLLVLSELDMLDERRRAESRTS